MDGVMYRSPDEQAEESRLAIYKIILFVFNFLVFTLACVLLGVAIWMGVDRNFMTMIIGNNLYAASVFIVLACGGIIFFVAFLGCCGVVLIDEKKPHSSMLFAYFVIMCAIFLFLLIAGILAAIFHNQIGDRVKTTMSDSLVKSYGVNFQSKSNRDITDAWDKAQERLMCCAVETNGWHLYRNSSWYDKYGAEVSVQLTYQVCARHDLLFCVTEAYKIGCTGCYDAGVVYLKSNAGVLIGLAFIIAVLLIIGIVMSALILIHLRRRNGGESKRN